MKLTILIVTLFGIVLTIPSCSDDPSAPRKREEVSSELPWQWFNPKPQGNDLKAVWVTEGGDVFAAGDVGTVLHGNGDTWIQLKTGSNERLTGIWADGGSKIVATTWGGFLLEYNGATWKTVPTNSPRLNDVLGIGRYIYAVGHGGVVLRKAGDSWANIETPFTNEITSIWGNSPDDFFVVGDAGLIAHYDGQEWQVMAGVTSEYLDGIWGLGPEDVYATGNGPTVLHYNGDNWGSVTVPVSGDIRSIWGRDSNDVFLVTREGEIAHYNGTSWILTESSQPFLWSIRGNSQFVFAVGARGRLLKYQNQIWERVDRGPVAHVNGLWALSDDQIYAVTENGDVVHFSSDGNYTATNIGESCRLYDIWGSDGANIYAVGKCAPGGRWFGVVMKFDGSSWTQVYAGWLGFHGVWGSSSDDVYAVGGSGEVVHYDGHTWEVVFSETGFGFLYDIWGNSAEDVFAVGGEMWLDGTRMGWIRHFDGNEWSTQRIDEIARFRAVWSRSPTEVYAVGDWSAIYNYDGTTWNRIDVPWQRQLFSVSGFADGDVFIGSNGGRIFSFDGVDVTEMPTGTATVFYSITATTSGVAWAGGGNGTVLCHRR